MKTLGQRALVVARQELDRNVRELPPGSNDGPRIRKYLEPCVRDVVTRTGNTTTVETAKLNLIRSNWCCAFACYCHAQALHPGERPVHGYRAGVIELIADVRIGDGYTGKWLEVEDVEIGKAVPSEGDLAVYTRAVADRPETSWWRHVNRIERWDGDRYIAIGGNERDKIRLGKYMVSNPNLLGFIAYPAMHQDGTTRTFPTRAMLSEIERDQILGQVAISLDSIIRSSTRRG